MKVTALQEPEPRPRTQPAAGRRVWLLTNTPSPYQVEFFSAIERSRAIDLDVRFMSLNHRGEDWHPGGDLGFKYAELPGCGPRRRGSEAWRVHPRALREVLSSDHDFYILSGCYTSPTFLACAVCLWLRRKRWGVWLERPWPKDDRASWATKLSAKSRLACKTRDLFLAVLTRAATRVLCVGSAAMDAYRKLGAGRGKLALLPYICDTSRYQAVDDRAVEQIRRQYRLAGKTVFLFSGQWIVRKGVDGLLAAFTRLAQERSDVALVMLGDGPLRRRLLEAIDPRVRGSVHSQGHMRQAELPLWFAAADVFVFPSRYDGWGVVLNEACAAGLPIITTDAVGASKDLVIQGENGFVVARDDSDGVLEKMRYFADHRDQARAFGRRSREIVERFSLEGGVALLCQAIESALHATSVPAAASSTNVHGGQS
jgi:glycosyltransferase involved in cell wall biosynthesis